MFNPNVTIRTARDSDRQALEDLARTDSQRPLTGNVVLAEQDGVIVAALAGGRTIADPFRPTAAIVALLGVHAGRPVGARAGALRLRTA